MKKRIYQTLIFFILLVFCGLSYPQSVNTKNLLDTYKDFYVWQEPKNNLPVSDSVLTVLGRWAWGPNLAVDADSNFAYIGNGPTFHVLDISDPSHPEIYGEYLTDGYVYDIELRNTLAFASIGRGLLILDITNPLKPEKISEVEIGGVAISLALDDSFVYVTTFSGVLWVVDISDINNPFKRGAIPAGGQLAFSVEAKDRYVYIGNPEYPPMVIVDANNPDTLSRMDFEVGGWGLSAFLKDTLLFVGVRGYYGGRYLKIYDVSNAAFPEFISGVEIQTFGEINGITVSEDDLTAYVLTHNQGIYSIDITDLTKPVVLDKFERTLPIDVGNSGIAISQNTLFASYYNGLLTLDVSKPDSIKLQSFFPTGGDALELDSKDSLVFVASGLSGLWILDSSNTQKIENIGNVITGGLTVNVLVDDTLAYIYNWKQDSETDSANGLFVININNPQKPKVLTHYIGSTSSSPPHSIAKLGNFLFITQTSSAESDTILEIIDVNDILNPKQISVLRGNYYPHNIAVKDSALFMATSDRGLRIIDISNIYIPHEVNVFQDSTFLVGIVVKNNLAFADRIDTLFVLDIADPFNPLTIGKMGRTYGSFSSIKLEVNKNYLYWAGGALGVIDVSDSTSPKELTRFISPAYYGYDVESKGNIILFSDRPVGIWLLKNTLITSITGPHFNYPKDFELLQNYPNPFNPTTTIEFNIVQREKVLIEIFDLLGQRVKVLLNEEMEKGKHKINFNAVGLSSGIYFYRIRTKETTVTKKMVILR